MTKSAPGVGWTGLSKKSARSGGLSSRGKEKLRLKDKCGCGAWKGVEFYTCDRCTRKYGHRKERATRQRRAEAVDIIYCPDSSYAEGHWFNNDEIEFMLEDGYMVPGMILEKNGRRYRVVGDELEPQRLETDDGT